MSSQNFWTEEPEPARGLDAVLPPGHGTSGTGADQQVEAHPVDQIAVRKLGGFNLISVEQWNGMRAKERKDLIRSGVVSFLYEGEEVPLKPALLGLRRQAESVEGGANFGQADTGGFETNPWPAES